MLPSALLKRRKPISRAPARKVSRAIALPTKSSDAACYEQGLSEDCQSHLHQRDARRRCRGRKTTKRLSDASAAARLEQPARVASSDSVAKRSSLFSGVDKHKVVKKRRRESKTIDSIAPKDDAAPNCIVAEASSSGSTKATDLEPNQDEALALAPGDLSKVQLTGAEANSPDLKPWFSFDDVRRGGPKGRLPMAVVAYMARWKHFKEPTAIQAYCWPVACAGRDVIGISQTGSGKTFAFVLPCLSRILKTKSSDSISFGPYAVVLAPTRELATQIHKDVKPICHALEIRTACLYGGSPKNEQIGFLRDGVDVIVATPGRLHDFAVNVDKFAGTSILSLSMVTYMVLDEADCMLDLGFEPQIRQIFGLIDDRRQTLFFSATWPKKVCSLAEEFLERPVTVRIGASESIGAAANKDVEQQVLILEVDEMGEADRQAKKEELWRILSEHDGERCLVFCSMKKTAAVLAHQLSVDGFKTRGLHGDMSQLDRDAAMKAFKAGETKLLVATDVAARGLDVQDIAAVINYDPAAQIDDHIHRIGRTSRAGKTGVAYTLLGSEDVRQAKYVAETISNAGQEVPTLLAALAGRRVENSKMRKVANQRARKKAEKKAFARPADLTHNCRTGKGPSKYVYA